MDELEILWQLTNEAGEGNCWRKSDIWPYHVLGSKTQLSEGYRPTFQSKQLMSFGDIFGHFPPRKSRYERTKFMASMIAKASLLFTSTQVLVYWPIPLRKKITVSWKKWVQGSRSWSKLLSSLHLTQNYTSILVMCVNLLKQQTDRINMSNTIKLNNYWFVLTVLWSKSDTTTWHYNGG